MTFSMLPILLLIGIPLAASVVTFLLDGRSRTARMILLLTAFLHTGITAYTFVCCPAGNEWLGLDALARIILAITSFLFLAVSVHTLFWLHADKAYAHNHSHILIFNRSIFLPALLAFLGTMTLVISARNFGLLWVAVEATTLVSAPLICYHLSDRSLEAMWKYLLICSVGIGLALFGTITMAVAAHPAGIHGLNMDLMKNASAQFHIGWFKAAFIFILAGYGTKMGLAPFHTWLPDAHSEAPGSVSALLSGALLNCSFLGIIRVMDVAPAELKTFCSDLLIALGLISLATAAFFIIRQADFKRMLAYSSVEHMGIAALLWGVGAADISVLHLCGHSLIKMSLFLLAGNLLLAYGTRSVAAVSGSFKTLPCTSALWLTGILLICGTPPSPLFVTEFTLIKIMASPILAAVVLILLFAVFAGMSKIALSMCMGVPAKVPEDERLNRTERLAMIPAAAIMLAIAFGTALTIILNWGFR